MAFLKPAWKSDSDMHRYINGWFVFVAGLLMITGGSASTALYFAGCVAVIIGLFTKTVQVRDLRYSYLVLAAFGFFWITMTPSFFFHDNPLEGAKILGSNLQLVFFALLLLGLMQTPDVDYMRVFLWGIRIGLPINFAIALGQRFFTQIRPEGLAGNALLFSSLSVLGTMLCLIGLQHENRNGRYIAIAAFISGVASIVIGLSKSAILAVIPASIILAVYIWRTAKPSPLSLISIALICIMFSGIGLWVVGRHGVLLENRISKPVERIRQYGFSPRGILPAPRYYMYTNGWKLVLENRFWGVGLQNTIDLVSKKTLADSNYQLRKYTHLHNEYLNQALGSGWLGIIGLLGMLFAPLLSVIRLPNQGKAGEIRTFGSILTICWVSFGLSNLLTGQDLMMSAFGWCTLLLLISKYQIIRGIEPYVTK